MNPGQVNLENEDGTNVFRVGVRIPPFWPEKPHIWFAQLEGQFVISNIINDTTKYYYVISQLEPKYVAEVEDIITNPPATDKYETLKTKLIERLSHSQEQKLKQLLMHEELGDRKPSQFLRYLQSLAGTGVPKDFIRTIWTSRLPHNIQTIIASQPQATPDDLAKLADKVAEIVGPSTTIHAASTSTAEVNSNCCSEALKTMQLHIAELTRQVAALSTSAHQRSPRRTHSYNRQRSRSQSRQRSNNNIIGICYYHNKFGSNAHHCRKPCNFSPQGNGSSSH